MWALHACMHISVCSKRKHSKLLPNTWLSGWGTSCGKKIVMGTPFLYSK